MVNVTILTSETPIAPQMIEFNEFNLNGDPSLGNILTLNYGFKSNVTDTFIVKLIVDGHITKADTCPNCQPIILDTISLSSNQTISDSLYIQVWDKGISELDMFVIPFSSSDSLVSPPSRYVIVHTTDSLICTIHDYDTTVVTLKKDQLVSGESTYIFHLDGYIEYFDTEQSFEKRGVWGVPVEVVFFRKGKEYYFWEPNPASGSNETTVGENGYFSIDFSFNTNMFNDPNENWIMLVKTSRSNSAAFYSTDRISSGGNYIEESSPNEFVQLNAMTYGSYIDFNENNNYHSYTNINVRVNSQDGAILRNMMVSKLFLSDIYAQSLDPIEVAKVESSVFAGLFHSQYNGINSPYWIEIDKDWTISEVCSHEYGHYVNYIFTGCTTQSNPDSWENWSDAPDDFREGWAMFYSFAARSYGNNKYGEKYYMRRTNTEESPFYSPRFDFMSYENNLNYCRFACFLWNVYDDYYYLDFMHTNYEGYNNDDVVGLSSTVFSSFYDYVRLTDGDEQSRYSFKESLLSDSDDDDLDNSIDDIYDFMEDDDYPMRSAQIDNLSATFIPEHDNDNGSHSPNMVRLDWNSRSYDNSLVYSNTEEDYKVYKLTGVDEWTLVSTINYPTKEFSFTVPIPYSVTYKVTSNNESGESYDPPQISSSLSPKIINDYSYFLENFSFSISSSNPFSSRAGLSLEFPENSFIDLKIFDENMKYIATIEQSYQNSGSYCFEFIPDRNLSNGVYYAILTLTTDTGYILLRNLKLVYLK